MAEKPDENKPVLLEIGKVLKPHGLNGELLVDLGYANDNDWWYSSLAQKISLEFSFIFRKKLAEVISLGRETFRFLRRL